MSNDKAVVYTTSRKIHANEEAGPASRSYKYNAGTGGVAVGATYTYNSISNTDYKVKANTKRRSSSKKYNDPNRKKEYKDRIIRNEVTYY